MIKIKKELEIEKMRRVGKVAARVLTRLGKLVKPGITTAYFNEMAEKYIKEEGVKSSTLNYHGYPASVCTSVNEVVCHGIPSPKTILKEGDIINIDITVYLDGFHGDTSKMFFVGKVSKKAYDLVKHTEEAMYKGIEAIKPGEKINAIGKAIEEHVKKYGYSVVRDYCGHGIGEDFHEDPQIHHYSTHLSKDILKPGMVFTVEPMINLGGYEVKTNREDGWTVTTADGSLSAQFEHTVLVTETGVEILTKF